jgi:5'-nucleotidase
MTKICLVNDDGPLSVGFQRLSEAISKSYELAIVVPDGQRSATGKSLTLNEPLRIHEIEHNVAREFYTHSGTPADSVIVAHSLIKNIDLIVSGINPGGNLGYQSMMTSGTIGATLEAAFIGYPALAVSEVVVPEEWFSLMNNDRDYSLLCKRVLEIIEIILKNGLPSGIDAISMNFPRVLRDDSSFIVTKPTRLRMRNSIESRMDPNNSPYYWIKGDQTEPSRGSDAYEVLTDGNISLSPIIIESIRDDDIEKLREFMQF